MCDCDRLIRSGSPADSFLWNVLRRAVKAYQHRVKQALPLADDAGFWTLISPALPSYLPSDERAFIVLAKSKPGSMTIEKNIHGNLLVSVSRARNYGAPQAFGLDGFVLWENFEGKGWFAEAGSRTVLDSIQDILSAPDLSIYGGFVK